MAAKEATVYIVDVGSTMREKAADRDQSNFDWTMRYVWDKLTTTISSGRKTLLTGVIALRSSKTDNELQADAHYKHIAILSELKQLLMPDVRHLRDHLKAGEESGGDIVSALVLAIQMITTTCKKLQYIRRIILVTDARAQMVIDDLGMIASKLQEDNINLTVLGVDVDDPEAGFKEENKDSVKTENEAILKQLCDDTAGTFASIGQAIDELDIPRLKQVKPMHSYRGMLTLGNPEEYEDALCIDVERYPKTMKAAPPTASQFIVRSNMDSTAHSDDQLAGVKSARSYQVTDPDAPGGKREVDAEDLARGYEYGCTAVHISESDQNVTMFETPQGLDIIGFIDATQYMRFFDMSRTNIIIAQPLNHKASMALSSFIHALYELDSYAVARFVAKPNKNPTILLLAPSIEPDMECLYDVELPYVEDIRMYRFPPLDRIVTVSGKTISVHKNLPPAGLQDAMDEYVDTMDLSAAGDGSEYMAMEDTFSPVLHHINKVIQHRAIYPDQPPPEPTEVLTRYSQPPADLVHRSKDTLRRILTAADVKKVPPKVRGKRFGRHEEKPLSNLDVGALLAADPTRKQKRISVKNAIPEYRQLLTAAESVDQIHDASRQLQTIIRDWIRHSVGDSGYGKALEAIRVMREELNELEEPATYNEFLRTFRDDLHAEKLGGPRKDFWWLLRVNKMGPIHRRECSASAMDEDEAKTFMMPRPAT